MKGFPLPSIKGEQNMSKEFFLRFSLQQMGGCMSQDVYTVKEAIQATEEEMDLILDKFKKSVAKRSDCLKQKYNTKK